MAIITIIGAGMMGSAISVPAHDNGHEVRLVGTHLDRDIITSLQRNGYHPTMLRTLPEGIAYFQIEELASALLGTDLVICGVSSLGVDWFASEMLKQLPYGVPVLAVTKGLELFKDGSLRTFIETFESAMPRGGQNTFHAVGGPCTSYELADRHQTSVVFCGRDASGLLALRALMQTDYYHINISTDILGVEMAVALKNTYALGVTLGVGIAEQREGKPGIPHYNMEAALFLQSTREMERLLTFFSGKAEALPYGVGDLYVTVFGGRTRKLGSLLGKGLSLEEAMVFLPGVTLESIVISGRIASAVRSLAEDKKLRLEDYPLLTHIDELLRLGERVSIPWEKFSAHY